MSTVKTTTVYTQTKWNLGFYASTFGEGKLPQTSKLPPKNFCHVGNYNLDIK